MISDIKVNLQPECLLYRSILGCALDGFEATRLFCYTTKTILAALSYSAKESVKQGAGFVFFCFFQLHTKVSVHMVTACAARDYNRKDRNRS